MGPRNRRLRLPVRFGIWAAADQQYCGVRRCYGVAPGHAFPAFEKKMTHSPDRVRGDARLFGFGTRGQDRASLCAIRRNRGGRANRADMAEAHALGLRLWAGYGFQRNGSGAEQLTHGIQPGPGKGGPKYPEKSTRKV